MTGSDPSDHGDPDPADDTDELDPTSQLPDELDPTRGQPDQGAFAPPRDADEVEQAAALRYLARKTLIWAVPLLLLGILLVALGLPVWLVIIGLVAALAIVIFEIEL
ncbi:MAG: hypothetical protein OEU32_03980 [Acidimicrobiia bacterium]|nr:hypothetical protein [Acidimicrobiia bacterium]